MSRFKVHRFLLGLLLIGCLVPDSLPAEAVYDAVDRIGAMMRSGGDLHHRPLEEIPARQITALALWEDGDERWLLVASRDQGVLIFDLKRLTLREGIDASQTGILPADAVFSLCADPRLGTLYLGLSNGVADVSLQGGAALQRIRTIHGGALGGRVQALGKFSGSSVVWAATDAGLFRLDESGPARPCVHAGLDDAGRIHAIHLAPSLEMLVAADGGVYRSRDGEHFQRELPAGGSRDDEEGVLALLDEEEPELRVEGTLRGILWQAGTSRVREGRAQGLPADWITALGRDHFISREAADRGDRDPLRGVWVGTKKNGLARRNECSRGWEILDCRSERLTDDRVTCILGLDEGVFVGTDGGGVNVYRQRRLAALEGPFAVASGNFRALIRQGSNVYAGGDDGLFLCEDTGAVRVVGARSVVEMAAGEDDVLWYIDEHQGLFGWKDDKEFRPAGWDELPSRSVAALFSEAERGVWFGLQTNEPRKIGERLVRIRRDGSLERLQKNPDVLELDWDASDAGTSLLRAQFHCPEFAYAGLDGQRDALAEFRQGSWHTHRDLTPEVLSFCRPAGETMLIGTRDGLLLHHRDQDRFERVREDPRRGISYVRIPAMAVDPHLPGAVFLLCDIPPDNPRRNNLPVADESTGLPFYSYLFYRTDTWLDYIPLHSHAQDLLITREAIWIATDEQLLVLRLREAARVR